MRKVILNAQKPNSFDCKFNKNRVLSLFITFNLYLCAFGLAGCFFYGLDCYRDDCISFISPPAWKNGRSLGKSDEFLCVCLYECVMYSKYINEGKNTE